MKLNKLIRVADAIERIQEETDTTIPEIVKALEGIAFSEEECNQIINYHRDEND